jgi:hypothetical protein
MENHIGRNDILSQPTGVSTFAIRTSQYTNQKLQKSIHLCHPKENYFLKSLRSKIFKTANAQARQTIKNKQIDS